MEPALAVILAGGRGKRMDILCHHRAKPVLSFAGNAHVIDFTLSNCKILPHVGPSDFRGRVVPSDSIVSPRSVTEPRRIKEREVLANVSESLRTP